VFSTCHATASPLAVSRPVKRFDRMPGPLVTEMKSGSRLVAMSVFSSCSFLFGIPALRSPRWLESAGGRWQIASLTRVARFSWCDRRDTRGCTPWYSALFEVIFLWKCRRAKDGPVPALFSTTATLVSSQLVSMARVIRGRRSLHCGPCRVRARIKPSLRTGRSHMNLGKRVDEGCHYCGGKGKHDTFGGPCRSRVQLGDVGRTAPLTCTLGASTLHIISYISLPSTMRRVVSRDFCHGRRE
jgi:hypothetical protein